MQLLPEDLEYSRTCEGANGNAVAPDVRVEDQKIVLSTNRTVILDLDFVTSETTSGICDGCHALSKDCLAKQFAALLKTRRSRIKPTSSVPSSDMFSQSVPKSF